MRYTMLVSSIALLLFGQEAYAEQQMHIGPGVKGSPPIGWVNFCVEYKKDCLVGKNPVQTVTLTNDVMAQLGEINIGVNRRIHSKTDLDHWGLIERWNYGEDGYGDCEDYVLLKRRALLAAGYPIGSLSITVVLDGNKMGHAVLVVRTDREDLVLDNVTDEVKSWWRTGYIFRLQQSRTDPNRWVQFGPPIDSLRIGQ